MTGTLFVALLIVAIIVIIMMSGLGKDQILDHPERCSDLLVRRTLELTGKMMDTSQIGSKKWNAASRKYGAAHREYERRFGPSPLTVEMDLRRNAEVSKEIAGLIRAQVTAAGWALPLDGESPNGFGKVSGYLFGFCTAACAKNGICAANDPEKVKAIATDVFINVYNGDIGAGILFASAQTTQIGQPNLHAGYDLGKLDAESWFELSEQPATLATLLSL